MKTITKKQANDILFLEKRAQEKAEQDCNFGLSEEHCTAFEKEVREELTIILGFIPNGFLLNWDPRGYSLKIKAEFYDEIDFDKKSCGKDRGGNFCFGEYIKNIFKKGK